MNIEICNVLNVDITNDLLLQIVIEELTYENPLYIEAQKANRSTRGITKILKNFTFLNGHYQLPRGYLSRFLTISTELGIPFNIIDSRSVMPLVNTYEHNIILRDYQLKALKNISNCTEGLLEAPAGSGKTIIGIAALLMCNQKSIWITHTKQLLFQFVDRVKQFLKIPETDIGLIYNGKWDSDKPITAALVQTLRTDVKKLTDISNKFGTVIIDECHHCPSSTFTDVLTQLNPYYLFGLTATPVRRDGLEKIMFQTVGPIRHTISRKEVSDRVITPTIVTKHINTPNIPDSVSYQELLQVLTRNKYRNDIIVKDVIEQATLNNICIVVTERVEHAEIIYESVKKHWSKVGIMVGKKSDKLRAETLDQLHNNDITVLVCTSHLLGEGFDYAPLNRLFISLPFRNITRCEQLVGRVQRVSEKKIDAIIYDYVDNHGLTKHQYKNLGDLGCRYNVYKKLGCIII